MTSKGRLAKATVRTVGVDHPGSLLHGTTTKSARAFVTGVPLPESERSRTLSEFGQGVVYGSDPEAPHQASMFSQGKGRTMVKLQLRPGSKVLDISDEVARRPAVGGGTLAFAGKPSYADDMGKWLQESRAGRGKALLPEDEVSATVDPSHPRFHGGYHASLLAGYARGRGYDAIRMHDETVVANPAAIHSAQQLRPQEIKAVHAQPRAGKPAAGAPLYSELEPVRKSASGDTFYDAQARATELGRHARSTGQPSHHCAAALALRQAADIGRAQGRKQDVGLLEGEAAYHESRHVRTAPQKPAKKPQLPKARAAVKQRPGKPAKPDNGPSLDELVQEAGMGKSEHLTRTWRMLQQVRALRRL